ncbi:lipase [Gordonia desulfuricans]|uniref:Lipase n=1 Tax=Gordonia desulfuricans TaxID=89051 RepID=A0A7K3LR64_9ACTN|nr:lipase [Gordonia desulfuricans]
MRRRQVAVLASTLLAAALSVCAPAAAAPGPGTSAPASPPGPSATEPFAMWPIPAQIPDAIDAVVGPPPFPHLQTIPQRAVTPGASHRMQELREATLPDPVGDPFFDRWAPDLDRRHPGELLARRELSWPAAILAVAPITRATQIKFATRDAVDRPSFGTATVLVPRTPAPVTGPRPVLVVNQPIDSLGAACTPGFDFVHGIGPNSGISDVIPPTVQLALARGYTVIVPDHEGPRMAYAEPTTAGHIVLDSLRAAAALDPAALDPVGLGAGPVAMTGYSGGAIATLGAAKLIDSYAPELAPRIAGAAIGGVPADFRMLVGSMNANLATGLFHAATFGIARERPEILSLANNPAQWIATSPLKNVCTLPEALAGGTFLPMQLLSTDPDPFHSPVAEQIYRVTQTSDRRSGTPLYIYQGAQEFWIPAAGTRNLFAEQCRLGANATYREVFGEHLVAAVTGYPEALTWLDARLRGVPAVSGCPGGQTPADGHPPR